jgi:hypothetical protein
MATLVPLNTFKTITTELTTGNKILYSTPLETATIILTAQATNVSDTSSANVTFIHRSNALVNGSVVTTDTELVKNFEIPKNDAASLIVGKIVLEETQTIIAKAGANSRIKLTVCLLETSLI